MKLNILQIICLINYAVTFPTHLFDELWQTNKSDPQANNNPIEYHPKIKIEPHEEKFDGRWRDESALKGIVKVEHLGAVKVEGTVKIKHELESWDEESGEFKEQLGDHVKEEDQDGQAPNTFDQKKIGDNDDYWEEDENNSAPLAVDYDQNNTKKHLFDQNNSTDQDESFDEQQNKPNKSEKIKSYQLKRKILKQFDEIKSKCKNAKLKNISMRELDGKIANKLGICAKTIYEWKQKFGLSVGKKKFSDFEKREILKQFDQIKSKCKKAKLRNISMLEFDDKIANKLGINRSTIYVWKRKFGFSVDKKKFCDSTKIGILKKYAKIKRKNPKMRDCDIADLLKISRRSINKWKSQFSKENKQL